MNQLSHPKAVSNNLLRYKLVRMDQQLHSLGSLKAHSGQAAGSELDERELANLITHGRDVRFEFEPSLHETAIESIEEPVCAFAIDLLRSRRCRIVVVGSSADGKPSGQSITNKYLRCLAGIGASGKILALPTLSVEKRTLASLRLALIVARPSNSLPVR